MRWTNRKPKREYLVITLGNRRPKVTATFFNAKYIKKTLVEGTRLMLSGEVGYFKGTMQLTHPAFLILESPGKGSKSLTKIAEALQDQRRRSALGVRAGLLPDLSGQRQGAELGHLRLRAPGARRARSGCGSAAGIDSCANTI